MTQTPSPIENASLPLTRLVERVHDSGLSGELVVDLEEGQRRLHFVDGELHFSSDHPLAAALEPVLEELRGREAADAGGAAKLRGLMARIAFLLHGWSEQGSATFQPGELDGDDLVGPLPTALLLMEWAAAGDDEDLLRHLGGEHRWLSLVERRSRSAATAARLLDPHAAVLLSRLSRPVALQDLLRQSATPRASVLADVARLRAAGLLRVSETSPEDRVAQVAPRPAPAPVPAPTPRSAPAPAASPSQERSGTGRLGTVDSATSAASAAGAGSPPQATSAPGVASRPPQPSPPTPAPTASARPAGPQDGRAEPPASRSPSASPGAPATGPPTPSSQTAPRPTSGAEPRATSRGPLPRPSGGPDRPRTGVAPHPASKDVVHRYAERVGRELAQWPLSLDVDSHRSRLADLLARAAGLTAYELLAVDGTATEAQIHEAFQRLARLVHPNHAEHLALAGGDRPLWFLFEQAVSAYLTLSQAERRRRYDERLQGLAASGTPSVSRPEERKELARSYYERAEALLDAEDFHFAVELLKQAVQTHPKPEYYVLLGRAQAKNPNWLRHAMDSYRKAVDLGADDSRISLALGRICEAQENFDEARRHYEAALAKNPVEPDARAGLARLAGRELGDEADDAAPRSRWSIGSLFRKR